MFNGMLLDLILFFDGKTVKIFSSIISTCRGFFIPVFISHAMACIAVECKLWSVYAVLVQLPVVTAVSVQHWHCSAKVIEARLFMAVCVGGWKQRSCRRPHYSLHPIHLLCACMSVENKELLNVRN